VVTCPALCRLGRPRGRADPRTPVVPGETPSSTRSAEPWHSTS